MNLLDFYYYVFKKEIREVLNKEYISYKLLSTPIRQELSRKNDLLATLMTNLLTHNPSSSTFFSSRKTINLVSNPTNTVKCTLDNNLESLAKSLRKLPPLPKVRTHRTSAAPHG